MKVSSSMMSISSNFLFGVSTRCWAEWMNLISTSYITIFMASLWRISFCNLWICFSWRTWVFLISSLVVVMLGTKFFVRLLVKVWIKMTHLYMWLLKPWRERERETCCSTSINSGLDITIRMCFRDVTLSVWVWVTYLSRSCTPFCNSLHNLIYLLDIQTTNVYYVL